MSGPGAVQVFISPVFFQAYSIFAVGGSVITVLYSSLETGHLVSFRASGGVRPLYVFQ